MGILICVMVQVCLHSDPPKPSQLVLSGVLKEGSKVITLSFPQAQRAELGIDALQPNQQRLSSGKSNLFIVWKSQNSSYPINCCQYISLS